MIITISSKYIFTKKSSDPTNSYFFSLDNTTTISDTIPAWRLVYSLKDRYHLPAGVPLDHLQEPGEVKNLQKQIKAYTNIQIIFPSDTKLASIILQKYIQDEVLSLSDIAKRSIRYAHDGSRLYELDTVFGPIEWGDFVPLGR